MLQVKKWEDPKLASLKQRLFFFHFLPCSKGIDTWELQKVKSKVKDNPKSQNRLIYLSGA